MNRHLFLRTTSVTQASENLDPRWPRHIRRSKWTPKNLRKTLFCLSFKRREKILWRAAYNYMRLMTAWRSLWRKLIKSKISFTRKNSRFLETSLPVRGLILIKNLSTWGVIINAAADPVARTAECQVQAASPSAKKTTRSRRIWIMLLTR